MKTNWFGHEQNWNLIGTGLLSITFGIATYLKFNSEPLAYTLIGYGIPCIFLGIGGYDQVKK